MKKYITMVFLFTSAWVMADDTNGEEGPWTFIGFFSQQMLGVGFSYSF